MRKFLIIVSVIVLIFTCFTACSKNVNNSPVNVSSVAPENTVTSENSITPENCTHTYTESFDVKPRALDSGIKRFTCSICNYSYTESVPATKTLKVLAFGNSFSIDAMEYLYGICKDAGVENIVLGNLHIGGCSIDRHVKNIEENIDDYTYYKNTSGSWMRNNMFTAKEAIEQEDWDIITIQQAPEVICIASSYTQLGTLINYIKSTKPNATIMWHMTWSYAKSCKLASFKNYNKDQMTMYNAIINTTKQIILPNRNIDYIIPVGTTIQNMRTSYLGDTLNRNDGYHLNVGLGRYTAALTWYSVLTGGSIDNINYIPDKYPEIKDHLKVIKECVNNALNSSYLVTQSKY